MSQSLVSGLAAYFIFLNILHTLWLADLAIYGRVTVALLKHK